MNNFFKKALYEWTYDLIKKNPQKFGGDQSNSLIMQKYAKCFHAGERIDSLSKEFFSVLSTVSRIKNKLLEKNPQFDYRQKNKPKNKKVSA
jgi:hypothetical protein